MQISLLDAHVDVLNAPDENKSACIRVLENYVELSDMDPTQFYTAFHSWTSRKADSCARKCYKSMFTAKDFGNCPCVFVADYSYALQEIKGLLPLSRFFRHYEVLTLQVKFEIFVETFFECLVNITVPIRRKLDEKRSQYQIYDTTCFEDFVKKNKNTIPCSEIKKLK